MPDSWAVYSGFCCCSLPVGLAVPAARAVTMSGGFAAGGLASSPESAELGAAEPDRDSQAHSITAVPLTSAGFGLALSDAQAQAKQCDYVLYIRLEKKEGGGGGGLFSKLGGLEASLSPMGRQRAWGSRWRFHGWRRDAAGDLEAPFRPRRNRWRCRSRRPPSRVSSKGMP